MGYGVFNDLMGADGSEGRRFDVGGVWEVLAD